MARRRRTDKHSKPFRPLDTSRHASKREMSRGTFLVRDVPAGSSTKTYTCPGCSNAIPPGTAHVVAWPETPGLGYESGLDERRHWHRHCWRMNR